MKEGLIRIEDEDGYMLISPHGATVKQQSHMDGCEIDHFITENETWLGGDGKRGTKTHVVEITSTCKLSAGTVCDLLFGSQGDVQPQQVGLPEGHQFKVGERYQLSSPTQIGVVEHVFQLSDGISMAGLRLEGYPNLLYFGPEYLTPVPPEKPSTALAGEYVASFKEPDTDPPLPAGYEPLPDNALPDRAKGDMLLYAGEWVPTTLWGNQLPPEDCVYVRTKPPEPVVVESTPPIPKSYRKLLPDERPTWIEGDRLWSNTYGKWVTTTLKGSLAAGTDSFYRPIY